MEDKFRSTVLVKSNCPNFIDVYTASVSELDSVIDISNIPSIAFKSNTSATVYNEEINKIKAWLQIASSTMSTMVNDYEKITKDYQDLSTRIFNEAREFKDAVDRIVNFSCIYIPPSYSNQTDDSIVGKIGNYICLPFYIRTASMYNGPMFARTYSSGDIEFTNIDRIQQIPLPEQLSMKIKSSSKNATLNVNITVDKTTANMIYYRFLNNSIKTKLALFNDTAKVYESEFTDSEVLANFNPVEFNLIVITLDYINTNTDKPFAVQLDGLEIFESIQFSKWGQFESKPFLIGNASIVDNINLAYKNIGDASKTNTINLVSVSSDPNTL